MASQPLPKPGLVGDFSPTSVVPSSPTYTGPRLVGEKLQLILSTPLVLFMYKTARFFWFFAFFSSSFNIQKEWSYNLRPIPDFKQNQPKASWCKIVLNKSLSFFSNATLIRDTNQLLYQKCRRTFEIVRSARACQSRSSDQSVNRFYI